MPSRNRPYDQFGPYILFKKLESDALTDLWRAARLDDGALSGLLAFRRFHAGNREALVAAANGAREAATMLTGTSFVRDQRIDVIDNTPFIAHEYAGGRSLRHIVERARGGAGVTPNPIPIDQAVVIAERVALSLATMSDLKFAGERMMHGALIPHFVWISDDGEIRVAGQLLGPGIVASLRDAKVGAEIGRYFSPEYQSTGVASPASEIYSLGAILYLVVTGQEPPDPLSGSAFHMTIRSARTMGGAAIPNDIRAIIDKSLAIDRTTRYATVADMKKDLSALAHGGKYSATTFNLAFYLSSLLKKEFEGEAIDREKETKLQLTPYTEQTVIAGAPLSIAPQKPAGKRRLPLVIAAAIGAVVILGVGAYFAVGTRAQPQHPPPRPVIASAAPAPPPKAPVLPETIVVGTATSSAPSTASTATMDDASAKKKAFEDAVKRGMQEKMMELQAQYNKQLQQQQSKNAPLVSTAPPSSPEPVPAQAAEDRTISAAQLDQQRRDSATPRQEQAAAQPIAQQSAPVQPPPVAAPQPAPATGVQEGDVVDITEVDIAPKPTKDIRPTPPPLAIRQHLQGSVVVTVLVSETGSVLEAKVLSGLGRLGIDEAALRAVRTARFSPAVKSGKRVRTWMPLRFDFKL
ncbi:MAG: TonB family protein [Thermoanaerobaculia bacterium]